MSMSLPPRVGPSSGPVIAPSPNSAEAMPCCFAGYRLKRMFCEVGMIAPPPMPWRMRKTTSEGRFQARAQSAEAAVNMRIDPAK